VVSAIKLDEIDAKILKTLLKDGRKKFTEIANIQGVNEMDTATLNQFPLLPYPREHMPTF